jgi:cytochrome P450
MSWTLFGLCQNLEAQRKLREELLTIQTDDPTIDELKSLPYLDMVVRESLRLYAPVLVSRRVAVKDTVLPMRDGSSIRCVWSRHLNDPSDATRRYPFANRIIKGDKVTIPIYAMNTDRDIWGDDALQFKCVFSLISLPFKQTLRIGRRDDRPERWESPPEAISENPGVWSNLMTFLGGSRACIGYQFTIMESVYCHLLQLHTVRS